MIAFRRVAPSWWLLITLYVSIYLGIPFSFSRGVQVTVTIDPRSAHAALDNAISDLNGEREQSHWQIVTTPMHISLVIWRATGGREKKSVADGLPALSKRTAICMTILAVIGTVFLVGLKTRGTPELLKAQQKYRIYCRATTGQL